MAITSISSAARVVVVIALSIQIGCASRLMKIEHQEFTFSLPADWAQLPSDDPERFSFESKASKSSIVLSIIPRLNIPAPRLKEVAEKFAEMRMDGEREARPRQTITFGDQWVELKPSGDLVEIAYAGYDDSGSIFRFMGFVTQRKIVSFWVATSGGDNELSKRVFDEAYKGLKFYVP